MKRFKIVIILILAILTISLVIYGICAQNDEDSNLSSPNINQNERIPNIEEMESISLLECKNFVSNGDKIYCAVDFPWSATLEFSIISDTELIIKGNGENVPYNNSKCIIEKERELYLEIFANTKSNFDFQISFDVLEKIQNINVGNNSASLIAYKVTENDFPIFSTGNNNIAIGKVYVYDDTKLVDKTLDASLSSEKSVPLRNGKNYIELINSTEKNELAEITMVDAPILNMCENGNIAIGIQPKFYKVIAEDLENYRLTLGISNFSCYGFDANFNSLPVYTFQVNKSIELFGLEDYCWLCVSLAPPYDEQNLATSMTIEKFDSTFTWKVNGQSIPSLKVELRRNETYVLSLTYTIDNVEYEAVGYQIKNIKNDIENTKIKIMENYITIDSDVPLGTTFEISGYHMSQAVVYTYELYVTIVN